jgi:hypothetical protein
MRPIIPLLRQTTRSGPREISRTVVVQPCQRAERRGYSTPSKNEGALAGVKILDLSRVLAVRYPLGTGESYMKANYIQTGTILHADPRGLWSRCDQDRRPGARSRKFRWCLYPEQFAKTPSHRMTPVTGPSPAKRKACGRTASGLCRTTSRP